jgi:hypothetical protein
MRQQNRMTTVMRRARCPRLYSASESDAGRDLHSLSRGEHACGVSVLDPTRDLRFFPEVDDVIWKNSRGPRAQEMCACCLLLHRGRWQKVLFRSLSRCPWHDRVELPVSSPSLRKRPYPVTEAKLEGSVSLGRKLQRGAIHVSKAAITLNQR